MKAISYQEYGSTDMLKLQEVERPEPKENEVLVKVQAAAVNKADWQLLSGKPFPIRMMAGLLKPKYNILGADIAGVVVKVGSKVSQFQPGDEVFGDLSGTGFGGFAEYAVSTENKLCKKSPNLSFQQAAALPMAATTALQGLRDKGNIQKGQKVLINGASGGVGSFAVQIAKAFEADVTAVASTAKVELVYSIGADEVIDYKKKDFTQDKEKYDLIFDLVGNHPVSAIKSVLKRNGRYVSSVFSMSAMVMGPWISITEKKKMINLLASSNQKDLQFISDLVKAGKVKPVIDQCFKLDGVPDAIQYLGKGRARGKVVIEISRQLKHKEHLDSSYAANSSRRAST